MSLLLRWSLNLGLMTIVSFSLSERVLSEDKTQSDLSITLLVYNYAHVPPTTIEKAQMETGRILQRVGIIADWFDCTQNSSTGQKPTVCSALPSQTAFLVRLLPRTIPGFSKSAIGFALPHTEKGLGCYANVFYQRVDRLAKEGQAPAAQVLGHAIAHEIGHLLLGTSTHAPTGIMRAQWDSDDLLLLVRQILLFTPEQARRMRAELGARIARQEASHLSPKPTPPEAQSCLFQGSRESPEQPRNGYPPGGVWRHDRS